MGARGPGRLVAPAGTFREGDGLNRKLKPDAVKFGAMGLNPSWQMRSEYFSQRYTTHWDEVPSVRIWNP
jgi:hypothetical protein